MPCDCCSAAREAPDHRFFSPACLWCGARLIQRLPSLRDPSREEISRRRTDALRLWVRYGHDEATIRRLVKAGPAFEPPPPEAAPRKRR